MYMCVCVCVCLRECVCFSCDFWNVHFTFRITVLFRVHPVVSPEGITGGITEQVSGSPLSSRVGVRARSLLVKKRLTGLILLIMDALYVMSRDPMNHLICGAG